MTSNQRILHPFTLPNGTELKNRLLMAPMTTCTGYFDGTVTSELVEYYRARAGSIGAIIVECCFIDDYGLAFPGAIGIDNDEKVAGLAKIAAAIKAEGSKAILQIYHGGRMVDPQLIGGRQPVAPSAIAAPRDGAATPRALSGEEVEGMIAKFGEGVRRAIQAGFDGVEIHGANTYLIQQFYSPNSNQRDDEWGGSRDNRARFPLAVLDITHKMARQYADDAFIIGYRFSPEEMEVPGIRFADTMYLLEKLAARGVDYLHFSVGATLRPSIVDTSDPTPLIEKYCAMRSETLAQVPVMGVGGVVNAADAGQGLDHGYDLMAVGRACIAYPDWTARIAAGEELELFIDSTQREALNIPEPLWRFSLVEAMIRDMSMGDAKFKPGMFVETVQDDANELVINVSLENDRIADIALAASPVQTIEFTTMLCFAVPGTVAGVSYILAFNSAPVYLTGTAAIVIISMVMRNVPVGIRAGIAGLGQIDKSLDEASLSLRAGSLRTITHILLPLLRPAILSALIYSFVRAITTVSAIVFLVTPDTRVATAYILNRVEDGEYGVAIAYGSILIVVMLAIIFLFDWLIGEARISRSKAKNQA